MSKHHTAEDWSVFEWPTQAEMLQQVLAMGPFEPGRIISVPLHLWPTYKAVNGLKENGISPLGNLYVKSEHSLTRDYLVARQEQKVSEA